MRRDAKGGRATFYTSGMEHSPTSATGIAWERTPWHATQRAAWWGLLRAWEAGEVDSLLDRAIALSEIRLRSPLKNVTET
jgi:hypothetical protein